MGAGIVFYINEDNLLRIKKISNRSGLINQLLDEYFSRQETYEDKVKLLQIKKIELEALKKIEELNMNDGNI